MRGGGGRSGWEVECGDADRAVREGYAFFEDGGCEGGREEMGVAGGGRARGEEDRGDGGGEEVFEPGHVDGGLCVIGWGAR